MGGFFKEKRMNDKELEDWLYDQGYQEEEVNEWIELRNEE